MSVNYFNCHFNCHGPEVRRSGSPEVWRVQLPRSGSPEVRKSGGLARSISWGDMNSYFTTTKMLEPSCAMAPAFLQPHHQRPYIAFTNNHAGLPDFRTSGLPDSSK
jgi:hypothetical protein